MYYFFEGGKYEATHSQQFCDEIQRQAMGDERYIALAHGCRFHELQDAISHQYFIISEIYQWNIPNEIIHPLAEARVEAHVISNNPGIFEKTAHTLDIIELDSKIVDIVYESIKSTSPQAGLTKEVIRRDYGILKTALGDPETIYGQLFRVRGGYEFISNIIVMLFNIEDAKLWLQRSIDDTVMIFQVPNWGKRYQHPWVDPSGFAPLREANKQALYIMAFTSILLIVLMATLIKFRKKVPFAIAFAVLIGIVLIVTLLFLILGAGFV